jgi:hypothetical protein
LSPASTRWALALAAGGLLLAAIVIGLAWPTPPSAARDRRAVLVYYANEASQHALHSENYRTLLELLRSAATPEAAKLASDIVADAREFPQLVQRDVSALALAAANYRFDLVAFTNEWALEGRFLWRELATGISEQRPLPSLPGARHPALATAPLSRLDFLRMALAEVAALFPSEALDIVLILNSHGSEEMILMPRVSTDLSRPGAAQALLAALRGDEGSAAHAGPASEWAVLQGISKLRLWNVLAELSRQRDIRFPLVFLEACQSGPASMREVLAVPQSVGAVAHTGRANIKPIAIDYAELLRDGKSDLVDALASALQERNVTVSTALTLWAWAAVAHAASIPLVLYLLPLGIWLAVYASALMLRDARTPRRARSSA